MGHNRYVCVIFGGKENEEDDRSVFVLGPDGPFTAATGLCESKVCYAAVPDSLFDSGLKNAFAKGLGGDRKAPNSAAGAIF